jgi:hypothetical protein
VLSRTLLARHIAAVVVGFPATPLLLCRMRVCISAAHGREDLDYALDAISDLAAAAGIDFSNPRRGAAGAARAAARWLACALAAARTRCGGGSGGERGGDTCGGLDACDDAASCSSSCCSSSTCSCCVAAAAAAAPEGDAPAAAPRGCWDGACAPALEPRCSGPVLLA